MHQIEMETHTHTSVCISKFESKFKCVSKNIEYSLFPQNWAILRRGYMIFIPFSRYLGSFPYLTVHRFLFLLDEFTHVPLQVTCQFKGNLLDGSCGHLTRL